MSADTATDFAKATFLPWAVLLGDYQDLMRISLQAALLLCAVGVSACAGSGSNTAASQLQAERQQQTESVLSAAGGARIRTVEATSGIVAIDAGGGGSGKWIADVDYEGGASTTVTNPIDTSRVLNAPPQSVDQSQRYGGRFVYNIANLSSRVAYIVRIHFVESFFNSPNQRLFNVVINGSRVLADFDVFRAAGAANVAIVKSYNIDADSSGHISIEFDATRDNASVAGLEVVGGAGTISPSPAPTSGPVTSGSNWPSAGWVPYQGGPLTARVGSNPTYVPNSQSIVDTLWSGRSSDAGQIEVYSGSPPPPSSDYSADVVYFGHSSDPQYTVSCYDYGGGCSASGVRVHIPRGAYPAGGSDHHIDIRDLVSGNDVMLWKAPVPNGQGGDYFVGWGAVIKSSSQGLDAVGSTASGISALWSLRETDLVHNTINHAIVVSVDGESSAGYVYPAMGWDNGNFRDNYPEMGAHFWLDVPPSQLPSSCPEYAVSYLTALNKFGAYFIDSGATSNVFGIQAESDMSYTYNGGASVWGPFMQSVGDNSSGMGHLKIDNCGINMQHHMHILKPPTPK